MSSHDSDDEPLSILAKSKNVSMHEEVPAVAMEPTGERSKRKKKKKKIKKLKIKLHNIQDLLGPPPVQRPMDVWLYLKDLSPNGPYSCLLCQEWFINKSKLVIHYILNHKKDYCGICRYFVSDQDAWSAHKLYHKPWRCSQCPDVFETEKELRVHFGEAHKLVHCKLCYFMLPDNDEYHCHLFQKHNVTNVANRNEEIPWEIEYDGSPKFLCLLCTKPNTPVLDFFRHFMCYHHFTLKCFAAILSGCYDIPFTIPGANISPGFLASQLHEMTKYGYVDLEVKPIVSELKQNSEETNLLDVLIPEIKQENLSDGEEMDAVEQSDGSRSKPTVQDESEDTKKFLQELMKYKGEEDFDVTLTELVIMQDAYYQYIETVLQDVESNAVHKTSNINYKSIKSFIKMDITCLICSSSYCNLAEFVTHMWKMHSVKSVPTFMCRVCTATFESETDYKNHSYEELAEFEDLWLCQFCDKEFDNREVTRQHLSQHWDNMELDNCFSPHIGFKCRYCPSLFWNEPGREMHHNDIHFSKHREDFYKCTKCNETFSDKVWFTHHYWKRHKASDSDSPVYLHKCNLCCIVLPNMDDMKAHFKSNHPEATKIFCSLEPCKFKPLSQVKSFKTHLKTLHGPKVKRPGDAGLCCTVCAREFHNTKALGTHMTLAHGPGRFKCKHCSEVMHSSDERKLHYLIRHPGQYHFECTICGKTFQYKSSLYIHRADAHSPKKETYTCNFCSKQFLKKDSYKEHLQIHEGPRHACSYCPMLFVQRSNMLRHERRHTGERPYTCHHCGRAFSDKGACNSHMRTHTRETYYPCMYCGQTFVQKSKLKYHLRKHTGEDLESCPVCSKLFTSPYSLREHLKTHDDKEAVMCPICKKTYCDERSIMRHIRRMHSDSSAQTCPVCGKTLSTIVGLRQHVLTHSKLKQFHCKSCPKAYCLKKTMVKHLRKRHGIKGDDANTRQCYKKLDVRECQLGLDDEILTTIFGRPKNIVPDVMLEDFVSFPKTVPEQYEQTSKDTKELEEDTSDTENEDNDKEKDFDSESGDEQADHKLEPPNFVSIKVEPMEDTDDSD